MAPPGRTWRPTPRRPGWLERWLATVQRIWQKWSRARAARGCRWSAVRAWMCTPEWPAGTGSGTATCAATVARPCSAAPYSKAGGPSTRSGSGRSGCLPWRSWPPAMATEPGRGCTSPRRRSATCGWTGPSEPDAPPPSSTRGRGMSNGWRGVRRPPLMRARASRRDGTTALPAILGSQHAWGSYPSSGRLKHRMGSAPQSYDRTMRWTEVPAAAWRTPQQLVEEGFRRSRVVMLNEAHDGLTRCVRTRQLGRQLLPSAHAMGARHLAMEALTPDDAEAANTTRQPPDAADGYLAQPDMRQLIQAALALGWTLWAYEADIDHTPAAVVEQGLGGLPFTNWREAEQARNLAAVLAGRPASDRLLVWCGNSHASKA